MDTRYLGAGLGFGGSCLGKDGRALSVALRAAGVSEEMVAAAQNVNVRQVSEAIRLAEKLCGSLDGKKVAVLGLAFKAGTDDIRESVSLSLIRDLVRIGADISVYDPAAMDNTRRLFGGQVAYAKSAKECLQGAECTFVATGWESFRRLRPADYKSLMARPVVVDGRRIYDQARFRKAGVQIATIGTGPTEGVRTADSKSVTKGPKEGRYAFEWATSG